VIFRKSSRKCLSAVVEIFKHNWRIALEKGILIQKKYHSLHGYWSMRWSAFKNSLLFIKWYYILYKSNSIIICYSISFDKPIIERLFQASRWNYLLNWQRTTRRFESILTIIATVEAIADRLRDWSSKEHLKMNECINVSDIGFHVSELLFEYRQEV